MTRLPKKLSDTLKNSSPVLGRRVNTFAEAYPTIEALTFLVTERSEHGKEDSTLTFDTTNFGGVTDCSNEDCTGGGVNTGRILHDMVRKGQTELEHSYRYKGREKDRDRVCLTSFEVKATVKYRDTQPQPWAQVRGGNVDEVLKSILIGGVSGLVVLLMQLLVLPRLEQRKTQFTERWKAKRDAFLEALLLLDRYMASKKLTRHKFDNRT